MVQRQEGKIIHARRLTRLLDKLDFRVATFDLPFDDCKLKLNEAWERYKLAKSNAAENRARYLEELARAIADCDDEDKIAKVIKTLQHREEQRRISKVIKYTTKRLFDSGTTKVIIATDSGTREIVDRQELEAVIMAENERKYHRTETYCPLLVGQLCDDIGLCGEGPRVAEILAGTYQCPVGTPLGTVKFIESMKQPDLSKRVRDLASFTSIEEYSSSWKRAKERSSSCGSLHYGHYKAAISHTDLNRLHFTMAQISLESGCYLSKHRQGVDVMLLKKEGDYRLHRLRTICLFDAEFNMNNGRVGKAALDALIASGDFSDEQYSRPCRGSLDHVVNRILSFNHFAYHKRPFGLCSCDLAGNYDRIVHSAASLALQRVGVPLPRIHGMFDSIQRLVKKVRTAYGNSDESYGGDIVPDQFIAPPQGVYQGNRNGPPIWSVISSSVFSILRKEGFGVRFVTSLTNELFHLCGFAFVDDSDLIQDGDSCATVAKDMQRAIDLWEGVMHATGQAMEPSKSWWYLIDFKWKDGEWSYENGSGGSSLIAHDSDGKSVPLTRLPHSKATKMLGVYLSPDGDMEAEADFLREKAMKWSDYIRCGHLSKGETWVALSTYIWKTITYPLPVTTFTEDELSHIIWPILQVALPRMGLCRNIAKPLRYGPTNLGGLGLVDPYLEQGIRKVEYLTEHAWKNTPTGFLIKSCLESLTLESGVFGELFLQRPTPLGWVSLRESWIQSAWRFCGEKEITISGLQKSPLTKQREYDIALMSGFSDKGYNEKILKRLNRCRLFLQVVSLSDISDATGVSLHPAILPSAGKKPRGSVRRNCFNWPTQQQLPQRDWTLWRDCLIETFCVSDNGRLQFPLGRWLSNDLSSWDWYSEQHSDDSIPALWRQVCGRWYCYKRAQKRVRRQTLFVTNGVVCDPPSLDVTAHLRRVTTERRNGYYHLLSTEGMPYSPSHECPNRSPRLAYSFSHLIQCLSSCKEYPWLFTRLSFGGDIAKIVTDFWNGTVVCGSDGSYLPAYQFGTASFKIESSDGTAWIRGECVVPGEAVTSRVAIEVN